MLIAAICIVFLAGYLISAWQRREYISPDDMVIQADAEQEYEEFIASLKEKEQHREKHYTTYKKQEENPPVILASFNPNTADSITFRRLGLPAWMAKNILHYRAKGGKFRKPEDFKKVYGMTEEQYSALLPCQAAAVCCGRLPATSPRDAAREILPCNKRSDTHRPGTQALFRKRHAKTP